MSDKAGVPRAQLQNVFALAVVDRHLDGPVRRIDEKLESVARRQLLGQAHRCSRAGQRPPCGEDSAVAEGEEGSIRAEMRRNPILSLGRSLPLVQRDPHHEVGACPGRRFARDLQVHECLGFGGDARVEEARVPVGRCRACQPHLGVRDGEVHVGSCPVEREACGRAGGRERRVLLQVLDALEARLLSGRAVLDQLPHVRFEVRGHSRKVCRIERNRDSLAEDVLEKMLLVFCF
mmetsp:Transcript_51559/g.122781  ORF Transcript_51559/g.122781 Transcript_51559/m.122781 type:complete len:234 (+) Transcript_51559:383-1084(+)